MKKIFLNTLLFLVPFVGYNQTVVPYTKPCPKISSDGKITMPDGQTLTIENFSDTEGGVFFIVRHAEKDTAGGSNADLNPIGRGRAEALRKILKKVKINGVYSTDKTAYTAHG